MGHYASEMDSQWEKSIDHTDKITKLRDIVTNIPLAAFNAEDTVILYKLFHCTRFTELDDEEIEQLRQRVFIWRRLNKCK